MTVRHQHAVVIGAGFAGLYAAQVLSEHFERVTVVERDALDGHDGRRQPVPQAPHPHFLLTAHAALMRRFPELPALLAGRGAPLVDCGRDMVFQTPEGIGARAASGMDVRMCTRSLLDESLLRLVGRNARVAIMPDHAVAGFELDEGGRRLAGLRLGAPAPVLEADLYVDASGRGGQTMRWFQAAGLPSPRQFRIGHEATYYTAHLHRPAAAAPDYRAAAVLARDTSGGLLGAWLIPVEDDAAVVTAVDFSAERPVRSVSALLDELARIPGGIVYAAVKDAPRDAIRVHRYRCPGTRGLEPASLAVLENYVVVGDALCATTPLLAIGLGMASEEAEILGAELRRGGLGNLSRRFHARAAGSVEHALNLLRVFNRRYFPALEDAPPPLHQRAYDWLVTAFVRACTRDPVLHQAYLRQRFLRNDGGIRPGARLFGAGIAFNPALAWRALRALANYRAGA